MARDLDFLRRNFRFQQKLRKLKSATVPGSIIGHVWRRIPIGPFEIRVHFDAVERPAYAYGVFMAAQLGKALGLDAISVVEFGVASGRGLLLLEKHAAHCEKVFDMQIRVFGFDSGVGLPKSIDRKDLPYWFAGGLFAMDEKAFSTRLKRAKLVIGEISETVPATISEFVSAPVGFCSFDVDYYSSTVSSLRIFSEGDAQTRLPRVMCYFDDIIGNDLTLHTESVGPLRAIREFNDRYSDIKINQIFGLRHKRFFQAQWNEQMYVCDDFSHPLYGADIRAHFGVSAVL